MSKRHAFTNTSTYIPTVTYVATSPLSGHALFTRARPIHLSKAAIHRYRCHYPHSDVYGYLALSNSCTSTRAGRRVPSTLFSADSNHHRRHHPYHAPSSLPSLVIHSTCISLIIFCFLHSHTRVHWGSERVFENKASPACGFLHRISYLFFLDVVRV
jgi:hypothetical protein